MWSSAMDLQMRLASDGYALSTNRWKRQDSRLGHVGRQAYGTTFEPAAIVYNKRLVDAKEVPQNHADFAKLIVQPKFKDKVTTYDIEKSGVGFMFMTQDARNTKFLDWKTPSAWPRCACSRPPAP
jgi:iron(III) transport system substrate-binding protein